jgi:hypothetical protein
MRHYTAPCCRNAARDGLLRAVVGKFFDFVLFVSATSARIGFAGSIRPAREIADVCVQMDGCSQ